VSAALERQRPSRRRRALLAAGLLAFLLVAVAVLPAARTMVGAALEADADAVRRQLLDLGALGPVLLSMAILAHAVVPYPGGIATASAGYVYGFTASAPVLVASWVASALLAYWLARLAGRPLTQRVIGTDRLAAAERLVERGGATALIAVRLVPLIPFNAVCYAAGLARAPLRRYAWTTLVGLTPFTLTVAYLGSRLQDPSVTDWRLWLAGGTALGLLLGVRAAMYLRERRRTRVSRGA
jgi:uncharacterized membrane protein YdjX (TVP38/TMEM64 family)